VGASGSGAGCGCGPGNAEAGIALGGLTNSSAAADLAGSRFFPSLFFTVDALAIEGAATAAIGVIRIVKESKQATKTLRIPGEGWRNCVTTIGTSSADFSYQQRMVILL
jgi:hypothetical protein